jgi:hypothetical protein
MMKPKFPIGENNVIGLHSDVAVSSPQLATLGYRDFLRDLVLLSNETTKG